MPTEFRPGDLAPETGEYEAINIFGSPIDILVRMAEGQMLPWLPRGHTWCFIPRGPDDVEV